jgi:hypothetical protein
LPSWHHPGTLTATIPTAEQSWWPGSSRKKSFGSALPGFCWARGASKSDVLRRFRAIETRDGIYGISLRQVFGRALASARRLRSLMAKEDIRVELPP